MLLPVTLMLRDLCLLVYGGSLLAFTVLLWAARHRAASYLHLQDALRVYRAWGPGLGLSLGFGILFLLLGQWLEHGDFVWGWQTPREQLALAAWLLFFGVWISNLFLEVWTLEPLRRLDPPSGRVPPDPEALRRASGPLLRHMAAHTLLLLASLGLFSLLAHLD